MGSLGIEKQIIMEVSSDTTCTTASSLPLLSLNHVSFICKSVADSARFYVDVLGFVLVQRPSSFQFQGAWLFNYGIGIHLLESNNLARKKSKINPKENHISFQCTDMKMVVTKLEEMKIEYVTAQVEEGGIIVDQLFFHDPDGYMVEICNCHVLPILPISSCPIQMTPKNIDTSTTTNTLTSSSVDRSRDPKLSRCSSEVEAKLMESLMTDMINIAF
ncbi:glyoxylase I 4 [Spinacia oleracea]|uniref:Glyoxylase I 4 n=1 Tax=Spinacia oleracea TaxID=3562 RepID=A0A9R0K8P3_SPIOL|nr:glyoxylase I 4-like [Spinacia oleracea]